MREVKITPASAEGNAEMERFLTEAEALRDQAGGGIYRVYHRDEQGGLHIITTTSKDVSLTLSTFSDWAQGYLFRFLEEECGKSDDSCVVFSIPDEMDSLEAARKRKMYVAMTRSKLSTVLNIAPVR